jgi:hypothetical protein
LQRTAWCLYWTCSPKWPQRLMVEICGWKNYRQQVRERVLHRALVWHGGTDKTLRGPMWGSVSKVEKGAFFSLPAVHRVTLVWCEPQRRNGDPHWRLQMGVGTQNQLNWLTCLQAQLADLSTGT